MSICNLLNHYRYGSSYDLYRRGFKVDMEDKENLAELHKELREKYYTAEELEEREQELKRMYGENIKGL